MPLPSDERIVDLSRRLLEQLHSIYGVHPGFRPAHAKGILLTGVFSPSVDAASISRAPHFTRPSTPVTVRFSNSTGLPQLPDNNAKASPRGLAVRFHLAERVHTDIISHSTDGFPTRTGEEFLEFLGAAAASAAGGPSPTPIETFLSTHPAARAFAQTPKPSPSSFAREQYFGVTALRFINQEGLSRHGRYRITPDAGVEHLDDAALKDKDTNFLFDELLRRIEAGPVSFQVQLQVAGETDTVDDATVHWPEDRLLVHLGGIVLTGVAPDDAQQQKRIIFDPIPRVDGIEPSADPLLEVRAAVYLLSGRRRREAAE